MMPKGKFITFEGGEGCGKSTQVQRLKAALERKGISVLLTREPGGTRLAEQIRSLLKDETEDPPCDRAELLLFLAARAQLVKNVIRPALAAGTWVVSDRFSDSTIAYQGYGRGLPLGIVRARGRRFSCAASKGLPRACRGRTLAHSDDRRVGDRRRCLGESMEVDDAYSLISRAIDSGHAAHGYLVCGDLRGQCDALTEMILRKLFPNEPAQVESRCHPDIAWLEPEGKSRTIHVKSMRERIVEPMASTAFSGGWKAGVIVGADRMELAAANSFLKTLEEPPPKTMFLLLTDQPDAVLSTIVSRSQRIDLPLSEGLLDDDAYDAVEEVLSSRGVSGVFEKAQAGRRLAEILSEVKDEAEDEDVAMARKAFYRTVMKFVRGWMVKGELPRHQAFRNVSAVEDAFLQSERYLSDDAVLCNLADRLVWPA